MLAAGKPLLRISARKAAAALLKHSAHLMKPVNKHWMDESASDALQLLKLSASLQYQVAHMQCMSASMTNFIT
jgi:hypothetical protein